jgi:imidazolonepropionase
MTDFLIYENISQLLTLSGVAKKGGRHVTEEDLGIIENASVVVDTNSDKIVWLGKASEIPGEYKKVINRYTPESQVWMPELVECHTHAIYGGSRHHDYALRCHGKTYLEIAAEGGGILHTLAYTREASFEELVEKGVQELERFQKYGVGTVEIKSGYGLTLESELKILEVIRVLQEKSSINVIPTFMPAHAVPPEFKGRADDFVDVICKGWFPEIREKELAVFFDAFVEEGAFTVAQARKLCTVALEHGFKIKLHADQFNDLGAIDVALEVGATSVDHLDHISADNVKKLAASNTVAVLLPGASLYTGTSYPPARALIDAGARVALSTDFNPGTCPSRNLPLMTTLACSQMKMTIPEAIAGITYNAALALGLEKDLGSLEIGKPFRICTLKADSYEVLPYCFGELE